MTGKAPDAFRTISEVADWLGVNAHVLRFWESKFSQVKPVKRAGGRRYYRPSDMELLGGIQKLLHEDGMTIKGVQKILREKGVRTVCAMSRPVNGVVAEPDSAPAGTEETVASTFHESADGVAPTDSQREVPAAIAAEAPGPLSESLAPEPSPPEAADPTDTLPDVPQWADPAETSEELPEPADALSDLERPAEAEPPTDSVAASDEEDGLPLFGHPPSEAEPQLPERVDPPADEVAHAEPTESNEWVPDGADAPPEVPLPDVPGVTPSLAEAIGQLAPGQIDPDILRPIHARLVDLRTRMDLGA
ncbi:MerR family transcriptional regulator [Tropicimonas isoalkanivorans]|uniref:MerR HTH family regulatory protein n=1 Tax=Tropicimonas isoalkanivorans TaxID=441112 RepID=A0A1I1ID28_9RHOB|nr:MerR family transcriptional regulator [Tropicimonas isoalkanivorans]SFC34319.1 MerR HTH family regulatory protein [Tropicimonas isoalkanivorans]